MSDLDGNYARHCRDAATKVLSPNECVVRALLGNYPRHRLDLSNYRGASILDLGFGDGRNIEFLSGVGFDVQGTEVTSGFFDINRR